MTVILRLTLITELSRRNLLPEIIGRTKDLSHRFDSARVKLPCVDFLTYRYVARTMIDQCVIFRTGTDTDIKTR